MKPIQINSKLRIFELSMFISDWASPLPWSPSPLTQVRATILWEYYLLDEPHTIFFHETN
jgi:hypothetical protein